jgi:hypothetical protein
MTPAEIARIEIRLDHQDAMLGEIRAEVGEVKRHAAQTNGRVLTLEMWRARIAGALAVFIVILIPLSISVLSHHL